MATADKLTTVAENVPKVYHAGQLNVFENTSTLKKSVSGSTIFIDDVSPITHEMHVKISAIPKKNLLNRLIAKTYVPDMDMPTEDFINTYCSKKISFKQGNTYTFSIKNVSGFSGSVAWSPYFYIFDNGSLFISNTTSSTPVTFNTDFFTSDSSANNYVCHNGSALWFKDTIITNQGPWSMTITPVKDFEAVFIVTDKYVTDSTIVTEAQIEVGSTATDYVPYVENPVTDLTAVKVSKYGSNLFDETLTSGLYENKNFDTTITESTKFKSIKIHLPVGTYTLASSVSLMLVREVVDGVYGNIGKLGNTYTFSVTVDGDVGFSFRRSDEADWDDSDNVWINEGTTATDYEPYIIPTEHTPNSDGTVNGVTSLYPNTSLMTDTEGVLIDCEYYKDIYADEVVTRTVTSYSNPKIKVVGDYAFYDCPALSLINFPVATSIGSSAFYRCSSLTALILRSNTTCALSNKNAFTGCTKITGTGGYIYVPSSLINTYKTATNWVTYASKFRALEDYTVDGTTTGALDESKVSA